MNFVRARRIVSVTLLVVCLSAAGCSGGQQMPGSSSGGVSGGVGVFYELPLIPIRVTYDLVSGRLQVSISGKLQTPIGTFGVTPNVSTSPSQFGGARTLTIQAGDKTYVYRLDKGRRYSISLPSDENGEARIIYSELDNDLSVVIPNPTNETVAGLREQLRVEQDARQREQEEAAAREAELRAGAQQGPGCCGTVGPTSGPSEGHQHLLDNPFGQQAPAQDAAQSQQQLDAQAREEEHRRQVELERQMRREAENRAREAERRSRDIEWERAEQVRRESAERDRRRDQMIRGGIELGRDIYNDIKRARARRRQRY